MPDLKIEDWIQKQQVAYGICPCPESLEWVEDHGIETMSEAWDELCKKYRYPLSSCRWLGWLAAIALGHKQRRQMMRAVAAVTLCEDNRVTVLDNICGRINGLGNVLEEICDSDSRIVWTGAAKVNKFKPATNSVAGRDGRVRDFIHFVSELSEDNRDDRWLERSVGDLFCASEISAFGPALRRNHKATVAVIKSYNPFREA